jgi:spermidine synthase
MEHQQTSRAKIPWFLTIAVLAGASLFVLGILSDPKASSTMRGVVILGTVVVVLYAVWIWKTQTRWWPRLRTILEQHTDALDSLGGKHIGWWILLAAATGLFAELMIIRWHASAFQLFGYFKNISLLSCFLGLGIGYSIAKRRPVAILLALPALALQFIVMFVLRFSPLQTALQNPITEQLTLGLAQVESMSRIFLVYGFLILVVVFNMLTFIPFGHLVSRLMLRRSNLVAYSWNLVGSLVGILSFTALAFLWSPPPVWLFFAALGTLPFLYGAKKLRWVSGVSVLIAITLFTLPIHTDRIDVYTPYQLITTHLKRNAPPLLQVNNVFYQRVLDLRAGSSIAGEKKFEAKVNYYDLPYVVKDTAQNVLVVGSGTGNDVAAALRSNVGHVDAVEIDPVILDYGKKFHPEEPYQSESVTPIIDDARHFIRTTENTYDVIVYGLLDSHTLLTGNSSVRLDSFVYTVEAFREARARLTQDGVVSLSFSVLSDELGRKLFLMLQQAFDGQEPLVYKTDVAGGALLYLIGPGTPSSIEEFDIPLEDVTERYKNPDIMADVSTDDWPFFYIPVRKYPVSYIAIIATLLVISLLSIRQFLPHINRRNFSVTAFFLGAGFLLIETKNITQLALAFGNTWVVVAIVIAGILTMAFLANVIIMKVGTPPLWLTYGLLALSLVAGMYFSTASFAGFPDAVGKLLLVLLLTVPLFFSGFAFSSEIATRSSIPAALSANLMGAMLGGFMEYNSLFFGFQSLYIFALVMYVFAYLFARRSILTI